MKRFLSVLICFLILTVSSLQVSAIPLGTGSIYNVNDTYGLLSEEEFNSLEYKAKDISEKYQCSVYIVTVFDYNDYGATTYDAAVNIFNENNLGFGENKDGILLMLSMKERDFYFVVHGYGEEAFTSYGQDAVIESFLDYFGEDEWYNGFDSYLDKCDELLKLAREGNPYDTDSNPKIKVSGIIVSAVIGVFIAIFVSWLLKRQMKSVEIKTKANSYIPVNSGNITNRSDIFSHRTVTRRKIEKNTNNKGVSKGSFGGGGFSGKGGKF